MSLPKGSRIAVGDRSLGWMGREAAAAAAAVIRVWEMVIGMTRLVMLADCCCHRLGGAQLVETASVAFESALKVWHGRGEEWVRSVFVSEGRTLMARI